MINLLEKARHEIALGLLSTAVLPGIACDKSTDQDLNYRDQDTRALESTGTNHVNRAASLEASWQTVLLMAHDLETRRLQLGQEARKEDSNLESLRKNYEDLFIELCEYAQNESQSFPYTDFTGIDRYKALDLQLYTFRHYGEAYPLLEVLRDAPLEFGDRRAFWWSFYRYYGVLDPGMLEEALLSFETLYPHNKRDRLRYATVVGRMYADVGRMDEATCMFEKALGVLEEADTLILGKDTNFTLDPRTIMAVDIARLSCTIAAFKDDETRPITLEFFREQFGHVPNLVQEIEDTWQEYQLLYRPLTRITGTTFDGRKIDSELFHGAPLIVEFGASWCGPCQEAIPCLKGVKQEFGEKVSILGISADKDLADLKQWIAKKGISWPYLGGSGGFDQPIFKLFDVGGIPYNIVVDSHGIVRQLGVSEEHLAWVIRRIIASGG